MRTAILITVVAIGLGALGWPAASFGQAGSAAKACGLMPTADLEAHFGAKASAIRGSDTPSVSMCSVDLPDRRHGADLMIRPPASGSLTVEQRLAAIRPALVDRNGSRTRTFGDVGCFTDQLEMTPKLPTTACFLDRRGYVSLSFRSDDAKHLDFEAVKQLLEKAAARRK